MRFFLITVALLACAAPAHAECVKPGDAVIGVAGKLVYGMTSLEPGETFPTSAQRGRRGNYYIRPAEPVCIDKGNGEAAVNISYFWINALRLDEATLGNMQGWIGQPVTVGGVLSLDTRQTGATAKIDATSVVQE